MRKKRNYSRDILSDRVYHSKDIAKFINYVMKDGKKSIAERITYQALEKAGNNLKIEPKEVFFKAMSNVSPQYKLSTQRRRGFSSDNETVALNAHRSRMLGIRWLLEAARSRSPYRMSDKIAVELEDAFQGKGSAFKKHEAQKELIAKNTVIRPSIRQKSTTPQSVIKPGF